MNKQREKPLVGESLEKHTKRLKKDRRKDGYTDGTFGFGTTLGDLLKDRQRNG